jgi:GNAT superfamily N-acetyltransferase
MSDPPELRLAEPADAARIAALMRASVLEIFPRFYTARETASAAVYIADLDLDLITDGTYFVYEAKADIVACGGWSRRHRLHAGATADPADGRLLDPRCEPARVRAMFVRADHLRQGLGTAILAACEGAASRAGFADLTLLATLPGVPLYRACGFAETERVALTLADGVTLAGVAMAKPIS